MILFTIVPSIAVFLIFYITVYKMVKWVIRGMGRHTPKHSVKASRREAGGLCGLSLGISVSRTSGDSQEWKEMVFYFWVVTIDCWVALGVVGFVGCYCINLSSLRIDRTGSVWYSCIKSPVFSVRC